MWKRGGGTKAHRRPRKVPVVMSANAAPRRDGALKWTRTRPSARASMASWAKGQHCPLGPRGIAVVTEHEVGYQQRLPRAVGSIDNGYTRIAKRHKTIVGFRGERGLVPKGRAVAARSGSRVRLEPRTDRPPSPEQGRGSMFPCDRGDHEDARSALSGSCRARLGSAPRVRPSPAAIASSTASRVCMPLRAVQGRTSCAGGRSRGTHGSHVLDSDALAGSSPRAPPRSDRSHGHRHRCHLDLWLRETMGIHGVPTPYRSSRRPSRPSTVVAAWRCRP